MEEGRTEAFGSGTLAGAGSFRCESCGYAIALQELDQIPACPHCSGRRFKRSSIFGDQAPVQPWVQETETPDWLDEVRAGLEAKGDYLAYENDEGVQVVPLAEGWTRIGRSLAADIRFDDPTVSRRHALVHCEEGKARMLDDRSLNGVFLNGERVEWHELREGDEMAIGRFRLYFVRSASEGAGTAGSVRSAVG